MERQRHEWMTQREKLMIEQQSLEERETVHVAASVYLVGFYQATSYSKFFYSQQGRVRHFFSEIYFYMG